MAEATELSTWKSAILKLIACSISVKVRWRSKESTSGGVVAKTMTLPIIVGTMRMMEKSSCTTNSAKGST